MKSKQFFTLLQVWINDLADILALKCIKPTEHNE